MIVFCITADAWSPSVRKVWIEIGSLRNVCHTRLPSPSVRKVWIEIQISVLDLKISKSPSVRKVWIEIV